MGPYTCTHANCGRRTMNDSHLCDEHDPDNVPDGELCCMCEAVAFGYAEGYPFCVSCYQTRPSIAFVADPPDPEDDEPDDLDATPILTDPEDPGEHLEPHKPDLGGES